VPAAREEGAPLSARTRSRFSTTPRYWRSTMARVSMGRSFWSASSYTLALHHDRLFVLSRHRGFQIDPSAMKRAGDGASAFRIAAQPAHLGLELRFAPLDVRKSRREKCLCCRILHRFTGSLESVDSVFAGLDQLVQNRYDLGVFQWHVRAPGPSVCTVQSWPGGSCNRLWIEATRVHAPCPHDTRARD